MEIDEDEIVEIDNNSEQNTFFDIHCIGKSPSGEGIIFFYRTVKKIIYSGVIDACMDDKILQENNIKSLNLICWTHPHKDHFEGLDIILKKYTNKNTKVLIPGELAATISKIDNQEEQVLFNKIATLNSYGKKKNGRVITCTNSKEIEMIKFKDKDSGLTVDFQIKVYAPIDNIVLKQISNTGIDYNVYSIILVIRINGAEFVFTGDTTKTTINQLQKMKNVIYVKIPHHGSEESIGFVDLLDEDPGIAVTTIFKGNGFDKTPCKKVLDKYLEKNFRVFTTNKAYCNELNSEEDVGIVSTRIEIPLNDSEIFYRWDSRCIGAAGEINEDDNKIILNI